MIDHEATQELASPSETGEPAVAPESGTPPVEAPLLVAGPAAPARRNIWPILIGALLLGFSWWAVPTGFEPAFPA